MQIDCKQIYLSYNSGVVLNKLTVKIASQEKIWISGPSGIGKSSFLKVIATLLDFQDGQVRVENYDLNRLNQKEQAAYRLQNIGYLGQDVELIEHWSAEQNLNLVNHDKQLHESFCQELGLKTQILKQQINQLSGGERQRVGLIRLLLKMPKLALLDEPTSHLDEVNTVRALNLIENTLKQSTVIIVSHDQRMHQYNFKQIKFEEINKC